MTGAAGAGSGSTPFSQLAAKINAEIERLFPKDIEILAEPGRFLVATAATAVARIIGKAVRDGKEQTFNVKLAAAPEREAVPARSTLVRTK